MASDLGTGSWLNEAQQSYSESFRHWGHQQIWTFKTWWRETTDMVILNSPWLRRGTGRALRSLWVFVHMVWWCFHYRRLNALQLYMLLFIAAGFFILGAFYLFRDRRESLFRTTLLCFALLFSSMLAANLYKDYHGHHAVLHVIVVLCNCNVHPTCVLLALLAGAWLNGQSMELHMALRTWFDILRFVDTFFIQVFEVLLLAAFTADFTARVKAVSSGFLFGASGEEVWKSPLAGRAGRPWCWVLSLNNWFLWAAVMVCKLMMEQRSSGGFQLAMQNHLPLCSCLAPCFSVVSLLILLHPRCSVLAADIVFGLFCCLPPALLTIEVMLIGSSFKTEWPAPLSSLVREMCSASILSSLAAVQIVIQAGCHPYICLFFSILVNSLVVALSMSYDTLWWHTKMSWNAHPVNPWASCLLIWILVASHTIDFFARMKGIREGMARSLENAASQSSLLNLNRIHELGLNLIELPHLASHGSHDDSEEERQQSISSNVAVAVVRHAERADASSTFDTWCTSDDAAAFPWDPPITERGFEQTSYLAQELASKHVDFKVIITSPFLRCLQTAMVLAEYFDADVLVDNELGEVMNTGIFETAPPLPPRPWSKVTAALKTNFATNRLKAGRFMGKAPQWPESSQRARLRYANRFLEYLRRARHTKKSCLLVTHGHMVQVCATILPATASRRVLSVDYAAAVLAVCHRARGDLEAQGLPAIGSKEKMNSKSSSFHMPKQAKTEVEADQQSQLQEGNELMQEAKLKYWDVWLQGVRTVSTSSRVPQVLYQVHQFQESLGRSYQDMVRLLGVLPPPEEFGDQAMSESVDSIDCQTTSSLAMYQDPSMIPSSPRSAVSGKSGRSLPSAPSSASASTPSVVPSLPRMNVKTFKEVELSLPSSSLAARRARKLTEDGARGLSLAAGPASVPILEGEPMESQAKRVDEEVFSTV